MSSRFRSNAAAQEWGHSSSDDHNPQRKMQQPAKTAEEAMWRAAKRIGSAWRWLKIDLALLAKEKQHNQLIESMENTLKVFGKSLLPDLGVRPLGEDIRTRSDVIDFVSILGALPERSEAPNEESAEECMQLHKHTSPKTRPKDELRSTSVQTKGDYMVRYSSAEMSGKWMPLDEVTTRRGAVVRCTARVTTDNAEGPNMTLQSGDIFKIIEIDSDGDFRVVVLENGSTANLRFPSERYWLLHRSCVGNVEAWLPNAASSEVASSKRDACRGTCMDEREDG